MTTGNSDLTRAMTFQEYRSKREAYMASSAPIEVKEEAIKELDDLYLGVIERAKKAIEESTPDYDDIEGNQNND